MTPIDKQRHVEASIYYGHRLQYETVHGEKCSGIATKLEKGIASIGLFNTPLADIKTISFAYTREEAAKCLKKGGKE